MRQRRVSIGLLVGLVIANALVWMPTSTGLPVWGGLALFYVIPGLALVTVIFPRFHQLVALARLVLGVAMSYVVSNVIVLGLSLLPGSIGLVQLVLALDIVSLGLIASSAIFARETDGVEDVREMMWPYVGILLIVLCFFRFVNLGYADLSGDELEVVSLATRLIGGDHGSLLVHSKGFAEITTTLASILVRDGFGELALRIPFTLSGVASVLGLYLLGREMFGNLPGLVGALLLAIEGVSLGLSRMIQFPSLILLMSISAVYCFWRFTKSREDRERGVFLVTGGALFAFGCLAHYDGVTILPILALLYLSGVRWSRWRQEVVLILVCLAVVFVISAPFYLPFALDPNMGGARSYVMKERLGLGGGPYSNVADFLFTYWLFYNSTYYVGFMILTLLLSLWFFVRDESRKAVVVGIAGMIFALGLVLAVCLPDLLHLGRSNYTLALFPPFILSVLLTRRLGLERKTVWLWFVLALCAYGFVVRLPKLHWYVLMPPWALLSGYAVARLWAVFKRVCEAKWVRIGVSLGAGAIFMLFAGYTYLFFIDVAREYAMRLPGSSSPLYWIPQVDPSQTEGLKKLGVPRQNGLKTVAYLYRTGILRGHLGTSLDNDGNFLLDWYLGHERDDDLNARYILYNYQREMQLPPDEVMRRGYTPEGLGQFYVPVGQVTVNGVPKLGVYESKRTVRTTETVVYPQEDYTARYGQLDSLEGRLRYDEYRIGSKTFFQAAGLVGATSGVNDIVVFTDPGQVGLFSYHYSGDLPYHISPSGVSPEQLETWLSGQPAVQKAYVVLWAAPHSGERRAWDTWLEQHGPAMEKAWYGDVGLGVYTPGGKSGLHLLQSTQLGEKVELLGYEVSGGQGRASASIRLYWAASGQLDRDYTVFTHIIDNTGRMWGQKDNQPAGGTRPTSAWRTDEVIRDEYTMRLEGAPAGEFWIEVGMYDGVTGERLPTSGEGTMPEGRIRLPRSLNLPPEALPGDRQ